MNKYMLSPTSTQEDVVVASLDLQWLAGLLEGEGHFCVIWKETKSKGRWPVPKVGCNMCDEDVIRKIGLVTAAGCITYRNSKNPKHKDQWIWHLNRRNQVYSLCKQLFPFMGARRQGQIKEVMTAYENALARRQGRDVHGHGAYVNRGCRCGVCREANREYWRTTNSKRRTVV